MSKVIKLLFVLACVIAANQYCAAQYTVTKIIGQVSNKSTGEKLKPGSRLRDDDLLEFSSPKDMIRVIVSGKGIYVISPTPKNTDAQPGMLVEMLKSALKIKSREGSLSGRSEETDRVPEAFETESTVNNLLLFTEETKYRFDPKNYDASKGNRFFLQLEFENAAAEIHALTTQGDTLMFKASDFKPRQQVAGSVKYKLGFFTRQNNTSESISVIRPYIDTIGEMETLLTLIVEDRPVNDLAELKRICYAEIYESMGKPSLIDFNREFDKLTSASSTKKN